MHESPLTQEVIDGTEHPENGKQGMYAKIASHPYLAGGALLAGAGIAFAAAKLAADHSADQNVARDVHVETSIAIDAEPGKLFSFWRNFENLPQFMNNLESVTDLGGGRSHWIAKGPAGRKVEWDAEIYNEIPGELIAWRSLESADIVNAGSVRFEKGPAGHGTFVRIALNYNPPAGKVGATAAKLLRSAPSQLIAQDLRRLKQIIEAGEVASIDGQPSGRTVEKESETVQTANSQERDDQEQNTTSPQQNISREAERGAKAVTGNVEQGMPRQPKANEDSAAGSEPKADGESKRSNAQHRAA